MAALPSFTEIHAFFTKVIEELTTNWKKDEQVLISDVENAITTAKAEALKEVQTLSPDVQAAVQKYTALIEQAVLAAIEAHLASVV